MNDFERCIGCDYQNSCDGLGMCRKDYEKQIERELEENEKGEN